MDKHTPLGVQTLQLVLGFAPLPERWQSKIFNLGDFRLGVLSLKCFVEHQEIAPKAQHGQQIDFLLCLARGTQIVNIGVNANSCGSRGIVLAGPEIKRVQKIDCDCS